jgi:hypothetical protein
MAWRCDKCDKKFDDTLTPTMGFNFLESDSLDTFAFMIPKHLMNFSKGMTIFKKPVRFCYECVIGEKTLGIK